MLDRFTIIVYIWIADKVLEALDKIPDNEWTAKNIREAIERAIPMKKEKK